jgi:hypothetical protein
MARRRHAPEQVVRKLREADRPRWGRIFPTFGTVPMMKDLAPSTTLARPSIAHGHRKLHPATRHP